MLIGQHVALHDPNPPPDCVGYIHTKMSPWRLHATLQRMPVLFACANMEVHLRSTFMGTQTLHFLCANTSAFDGFELVKNSLRAVEERFVDSDKVAPPVRIIVADGLEDVTIKISDEGVVYQEVVFPKFYLSLQYCQESIG